MNFYDFFTENLSRTFVKIGEASISFGKLLLFLFLVLLTLFLAKKLAIWLGKVIYSRLRISANAVYYLKALSYVFFLGIGFIIAFRVLGFTLKTIAGIFNVINYPLFKIGDTPIGLSSIFIFLFLILLFLHLSRFVSKLVIDRGLARIEIEKGKKYIFRRVTEYALVIIGAIIAFQTIGIDLSGLAVIFGMLSVGVGFGLQNVTSNFISGLILLFERPIKVGDRISIEDIQGDVEEINIRSTTIKTLDNIIMIVPNSEFVSGRVTNWSHSDLKIRMNIEVGVSYNSNLDDVLKALREVADENSKVMNDPEPEVIFMEFGDSSWNMRLRIWVRNPKDYYHVLSEINCAIVRKFREYKVEIPFPQRDVHVRSPLPVPLEQRGEINVTDKTQMNL